MQPPHNQIQQLRYYRIMWHVLEIIRPIEVTDKSKYISTLF